LSALYPHLLFVPIVSSIFLFFLFFLSLSFHLSLSLLFVVVMTPFFPLNRGLFSASTGALIGADPRPGGRQKGQLHRRPGEPRERGRGADIGPGIGGHAIGSFFFLLCG